MPWVISQSSQFYCVPRGCKARNCSCAAMRQPRCSAKVVRLVCTSHHRGPLLRWDSISLALPHAEEGRVGNWQWVLMLITRQVLIACNCWQQLPSSRTREPNRLCLPSLCLTAVAPPERQQARWSCHQNGLSYPSFYEAWSWAAISCGAKWLPTLVNKHKRASVHTQRGPWQGSAILGHLCLPLDSKLLAERKDTWFK